MTGPLPRQTQIQAGRVYHERWLMRSSTLPGRLSQGLTHDRNVTKWSIPAFDLGNPMMDYLQRPLNHLFFYGSDPERQEQARGLTITLLPGSRPPEAYANWQKILVAVAGLCFHSLAFYYFGCDRTV